ncbi:cysteine/glutathione ABC transporter ATP-binding protein/permease CydC [Parendozoicomonas sp. Alg238-R29]|uniref:heme ABC transporter ATP-binding protein/permease CydC n=1 Tax=Parendozoicomonas sp. Alg238-R29 TaxID=2993446 RepID=UPI00248E3E8D|nr:cysteine/glutathione ABC transporter ATP-binding protein/permease CydC [Parendozoicomonas sp. Alg238-R29]
MSNSLVKAFRDIWPYLKLTGRYGGRFGIGYLLSLATLVASVGLLALSGWFITATALAGLTVATAQVFNFFTPGAGVRGFSIARTAGRYGERLVTHDATFRLLAGLRVWFFEKVEPLAPAGLRNFRQADLLNRLVADIDTLDGLYLRLLSPLLLAVTGSVALVILSAVFASGTSAFLTVVLAGIVLILPGLFYRLGRESGDSLVNTRSVLRTRLLDFVSGQTELHLSGATARYRESIEQAEAQTFADENSIARVTGLSLFLITWLTGVTVAGVLWLGIHDMQAASLEGPFVVMLVLATMAAFEAIMPLPGAFQMLGQTRRSAVRLSEVAEQKPVVVFPGKSLNEEDDLFSAGRLDIHGVSFSYPTNNSVLRHFNLTLEPGERVALVGPTGCGKSTLLQLLTRDWPCEGSISLNGQLLESFSERDLRRQMAVMPQRIHMFSATLRDNLLMACTSAIDKLSDESLLEVLEQVGLNHLAPEHELLDIWFGAAGQSLSGGELRRIGLARVLLRLRDPDCRLVLLDEPTEGLDPETEGRMIAVLNEELLGKTLLMVTHRPAALELVERVVKLD